MLTTKNKEIQDLKVDLEGQHSNIEQEYNTMNDEFDRALNLISR